MWILSFLPDFVFHLALLVGVAGIVASFVLTFIPFISQYKLPIQVAAIALTIFGVYFEGGLSEKAAWEARVLEMQAKVAQAETQAANANAKITAQVATKIQYVKDTTNANQQMLSIYGQSLNDSCRLTNGAVLLHNSASQNQVSGSTSTAAGGTSDVKASQLLSTVIANYGVFYEMREKLLAWQQWYKEQKEISDSVN